MHKSHQKWLEEWYPKHEKGRTEKQQTMDKGDVKKNLKKAEDIAKAAQYTINERR